MIDAAFWSRVNKKAHGDCWLWCGYVQRFGHGALSRRGKTVLAHRHAWHLVKGPIPAGKCVLHRCDVPACVNPEHLFLGSREDNMHDCYAKGRQTRGEKNPHAKVTEAQVREIRASHKTFGSWKKTNAAELAAKYGVHVNIINNIVARRTWKHV